jgi:hypothetical protein
MRTDRTARQILKSQIKLSARRTKKWNLGWNLIDSGTIHDFWTVTSNDDIPCNGPSATRSPSFEATGTCAFALHLQEKRSRKFVTCSPLRTSSLLLEFGDWSGPNGTLIKRRYSGPLQEIKKELKRRTDSVAFRPIWV